MIRFTAIGAVCFVAVCAPVSGCGGKLIDGGAPQGNGAAAPTATVESPGAPTGTIAFGGTPGAATTAAPSAAGGAPSGVGGVGAVPNGGSLGSGGPPDAGVPCGRASCSAPPPAMAVNIFLSPPKPCCADPAASICGTMSSFAGGSGACTPVAVVDARCPSTRTEMGSVGYVGCCIDDECGLDYSYVGEGCVADSDPRTAVYLQGVTPAHCDGTPIASD